MEHNVACYAYCIRLIRAVMREEEIPPIPQDITLEELFAFAKLHTVEALMYYGLCQLELDMTHPVWQNWENRVSMLLAQSIVQLEERDHLFTVLTEAEIDLLPFKGCWLKELYPNMEYRQMSDLDMLIPPEKAAQAKQIMLSLGYEGETVENALNHAGYLKPPYTEVELHVSPLEKDNGYYDDIWQKAKPVEGYSRLYRLTPEDEYIFYILHLNRHLEDAGTGIRFVLDAIVYQTVYPNLDRAYLKQELDKWNLWHRAIQIETLANCWFRTGEAVPEELEELAWSFLTTGVYGTLENRSQNRIKKLEGKYKNPVIRGIVYWTLRTCRPLDEMQLTYPLLKKLPVLLPVFWVYRAVMKVASRPREIWNHIKLVFRGGKEHG